MKTLVMLLLLISISSTAHAGGTSFAYIPKGCDLHGAEYSTGGGGKVVQYLEILCKFKDGRRAIYIDRIGSLGGLVGLGRFTQPDKIIFLEHDKDELIVK